VGAHYGVTLFQQIFESDTMGLAVVAIDFIVTSSFSLS